MIRNLFIAFFLVSTALSAQVKFEAKVSKKKLGVNERLRIDFVMNKDGDNFTPPSFQGFKIIGGPNQAVSNSWTNGKRTFSKTYTYFLAPLKRGKFTIKQATIEIEGETYKTLPVPITVTAAVEIPKDPNDPNYIAEENIHLVAEVSNSKPYLNEPITVTYKLYVGPYVNARDYDVLDSPKYNDFWSQNIEIKRYTPERGVYEGKQYNYYVLKRVVLYPQKSGKLSIQPLSLNVSVDVATNRRDFFGGRIYSQAQKTVTAGKRTINVKPLPEAGKPDNFTGAVGDFTFKVTTTKSELNANESLQAKVEVSGKGNLKLFNLPKLNVPSSLEIYEPEHDESVRTNLSGMRGKIADSYTIVPQYQGKYPIPTISFSYFDLNTESYKTLTSDELIVNVLEGPTNASAVEDPKTNTTTKQVVTTSNSQFRSFKLSPNLQSMARQDFFGTRSFYMLLLLPFLIIPIALFIGKKKRQMENDVEGNKVRKANRLAKRYLSEAKKALGTKESFYEALERALHNYLKAKLKIETSEFSKEKIQELLGQRNVSFNTTDGFVSLLKSCEFARYTPASGEAMKQDYQKAVEVISQIDKQIS